MSSTSEKSLQSNMVTIIPELIKNFKTIDLRPLYDKTLSWQAKGLHTYLISRPDNWVLNKTDLINRSKNGRDAVQAMLKELKDAGYLFILQLPSGENGHLKTFWFVYSEKKVDISQHTEKLKSSLLEIRTPGNPDSGKSTSNNKDLLKERIFNNCINSAREEQKTGTEETPIKSNRSKHQNVPKVLDAATDMSTRVNNIIQEMVSLRTKHKASQRGTTLLAQSAITGGQIQSDIFELCNDYNDETIVGMYEWFLKVKDDCWNGHSWRLFWSNLEKIEANYLAGKKSTINTPFPKQSGYAAQTQSGGWAKNSATGFR